MRIKQFKCPNMKSRDNELEHRDQCLDCWGECNGTLCLDCCANEYEGWDDE